MRARHHRKVPNIALGGGGRNDPATHGAGGASHADFCGSATPTERNKRRLPLRAAAPPPPQAMQREPPPRMLWLPLRRVTRRRVTWSAGSRHSPRYRSI